MRRSTRTAIVLACALACILALLLAGCSRGVQPVLDSRETLGTVVSVTAYPAEGADDTAVRSGIDDAYEAMAEVEAALDVHDPASRIAKINASGEGTLPPEAVQVLHARDRLDVDTEFSPCLYAVVNLYSFEGSGSVPATGVAGFLADCAREDWSLRNGAITLLHRWGVSLDPTTGQSVEATIGLDFGGAAKGLALDDAVATLDASGQVSAALISSGSTTVTFGSKPDGEPWRIGVEDPRNTDETIATIEAKGAVTVSTSGDYQRYFVRDGVRYHHILDPRTGLPARGLRSLTVVGAANGLDSDILSTALFVMGPERATSYAEEHGLGLVLVDEKGRVRIVPGPSDAPWRVVETTR